MWRDSRVVWGLLLILAGAVALLQQFNVLPAGVGWLWMVLLGAAGLAFVGVFVTNRTNWWALIPGGVLLDVAMVIGLGEALPEAVGAWAGVAFLLGLGLTFAAVYLTHHEQWWAIIPAGALATLAAVAGVNDLWTGLATGALFFFGLAVTFALVWLAPTSTGRHHWAAWPMAGLALVGLLLATPLALVANWLWAATLIGAGLWLLLGGLRPRIR